MSHSIGRILTALLFTTVLFCWTVRSNWENLYISFAGQRKLALSKNRLKVSTPGLGVKKVIPPDSEDSPSRLGSNPAKNKDGNEVKFPQRDHEIHFRTYGNDRFVKSKQRIVKEANQTGWFASVRALGPEDLPPAFTERYRDILKQPRGGGYWIWKYALIEMTLSEIRSGDFLVYMDAGCTVNPAGALRFDQYVAMLTESPFDVLHFQLQHPEHTYTTDRVFQAFGIDTTNWSVRDSGQCAANVLLIRKGDHLRRWLSLVKQVLERDPWIITDKYNDEARRLDPQFKDARHDQSVSSVSLKIVGSVVIQDETYPPGQVKYPFWASRIRH